MFWLLLVVIRLIPRIKRKEIIELLYWLEILHLINVV
jgi:hypothetical protein